MRNGSWGLMFVMVLSAGVQAQDVGYGDAFLGPASVGSSEPLFRYDDQERWKHGIIKDMPYYEGFHAFRPYNYHHVFGQSQISAGWGMPAVMPYSQQFWHRYEKMVDLSRGDRTPVAPYVKPIDEWDHYPQPIRPGASLGPSPADRMPGWPIQQEQTSPSAASNQMLVVPAQGLSQSGPLLTPQGRIPLQLPPQ